MLVDGQKQPVAGPTTNLLLAPGPHTIVVRAPNRKTFLHSGGLANGENVLLRPSLRRATPLWATIVTGSLALVSLGIATGLGVKAQSDRKTQDAINSRCGLTTMAKWLPDCEERGSEQTKIRLLADSTNALFSIGGILVVGSAALAITTEWSF